MSRKPVQSELKFEDHPPFVLLAWLRARTASGRIEVPIILQRLQATAGLLVEYRCRLSITEKAFLALKSHSDILAVIENTLLHDRWLIVREAKASCSELGAKLAGVDLAIFR